MHVRNNLHRTVVRMTFSTACYPQDWTFTTRCDAGCNVDGVPSLAGLGCYQTKHALGDPEAGCDEGGGLNLSDHGCFQAKYAMGCPWPFRSSKPRGGSIIPAGRPCARTRGGHEFQRIMERRRIRL
jgi:hypothetical protein